jgi:hypothetical protein
VNAGRVPLEFWSVDVNKIEAHVKQHGAAAVIPGVRVFMKPIVSVRA